MKTDSLQWLTWAFLFAVAAETLTRLWLGSRQIAAVQAHRDEVPEPFRGQIALADQQKAADYTTARARLGRWESIAAALCGGLGQATAAGRVARRPAVAGHAHAHGARRGRVVGVGVVDLAGLDP